MSPPEVWGPAVWRLFHTLSYRINDNAYNVLAPQLFTLFVRICKFLPCPECSTDASNFLAKIKLSNMKNKTEFKNTFYLFHNYVNAKKRKPLFNYGYINIYNQYKVIDAFITPIIPMQLPLVSINDTNNQIIEEENILIEEENIVLEEENIVIEEEPIIQEVEEPVAVVEENIVLIEEPIVTVVEETVAVVEETVAVEKKTIVVEQENIVAEQEIVVEDVGITPDEAFVEEPVIEVVKPKKNKKNKNKK